MGSDNGVKWWVRRQAIIWTNAGVLLDPSEQGHFNKITTFFIEENVFENFVCKMPAILSRTQWVESYDACLS